MNRRMLLAVVCLLAAFSSLPVSADDGNGSRDDDGDGNSVVYTMTNDAASNSIVVYGVAGGALTQSNSAPTGGKGTGAGLGSQGALVLSNSKRWLLAVNAGSDDISVFRVSDSGIDLTSRTPSGGHSPISITISGRLVFVLNAGLPNTIAGFWLGRDGKLTAIPGSIRGLSAPSVDPAQVQFSPDGDQLVVTEKATNLIDVFPVGRDGSVGARVTTPSSGMTPFGFAFGRRNRLFVSEAFGGAPNASAASSYVLHDSGALHLVSGSVPTTQTAACWLVVDSSGRYAYTTNTGSRTVSLLGIARNGALTLLSAAAGATPAGSAIDAAFSGDSRLLHVLTAGAASIVTFRVAPDGRLIAHDTVPAPAGAVGLAAR
jgi:6-phosphogluconolactonase